MALRDLPTGDIEELISRIVQTNEHFSSILDEPDPDTQKQMIADGVGIEGKVELYLLNTEGELELVGFAVGILEKGAAKITQ